MCKRMWGFLGFYFCFLSEQRLTSAWDLDWICSDWLTNAWDFRQGLDLWRCSCRPSLLQEGTLACREDGVKLAAPSVSQLGVFNIRFAAHKHTKANMYIKHAQNHLQTIFWSSRTKHIHNIPEKGEISMNCSDTRLLLWQLHQEVKHCGWDWELHLPTASGRGFPYETEQRSRKQTACHCTLEPKRRSVSFRNITESTLWWRCFSSQFSSCWGRDWQ